MDWNPLTWTFASNFLGFSLLKWGIVIGGIIFLALLRKFILEARKNKTEATVHAHASKQVDTAAANAAAIDDIVTPKIPVVEKTPEVVVKTAKVKAFKRAVVVAKMTAKKKRKAKAKKIIPAKKVEPTPAAVVVPAPTTPIVNVKTEAVVVKSTAAPAKEAAPTIVVKPKTKKVKKVAKAKKPAKVIPFKPIITTPSPAPAPVVVAPVVEKKEAPMIIATARRPAPTPVAKTETKKVVAVKPKVVEAPKAKPVEKQTTPTKTETTETKPATNGKSVRARNPGFI